MFETMVYSKGLNLSVPVSSFVAEIWICPLYFYDSCCCNRNYKLCVGLVKNQFLWHDSVLFNVLLHHIAESQEFVHCLNILPGFCINLRCFLTF